MIDCDVAIFAAGDGDVGALPRQLLAQVQERAQDNRATSVQLIDGDTLQVEHALILKRSALVLFIESSPDATTPCALTEIEPAKSTHAQSMTDGLTPSELVRTMALMTRRDAPPCFQLALHQEETAAGAHLSSAARGSLEAATKLLHWLLDNPSAAQWRSRISGS